LTSTSDVIIKDGVQEEGFAGNISEDSEEDDCGCECPEACPYDNMVALPKDLYKDAKAEYAAKIAAEKLEPLVVEMALPWADILAMNPEDLDAQILLPMFEDALENQMKENPELRHALPNKPNHLQEQVEMVL
jgi:sirohydrochlorin ferrochelatase